MIKNNFKFIVLIILVFIVNACSSNSNSFWGFKPHFSTGTYIHSYMTVNGKEYIMSKEKIRQSVYNTYHYDLPIKITNTNYNEYILDIGEIEIIDTDGKIIRPRTKIPPILFKKTIYRTFVNDITGSDYDVYYRGWAEDYPKDPSTLKKMYNNLEKKFGKLKNIKK